jgi:hypothetical protein
METHRSRDNKVKCAVLDTNILIYSFLFKIDLINQLRDIGISKILLPEAVVSEIKKLSSEMSGKEGKAAKLTSHAIENWIKEGVASIVPSTGKTADIAVLNTAEKYGCVLITNDKKLRLNARKCGVVTGYLRGKNRIEIADVSARP